MSHTQPTTSANAFLSPILGCPRIASTTMASLVVLSASGPVSSDQISVAREMRASSEVKGAARVILAAKVTQLQHLGQEYT